MKLYGAELARSLERDRERILATMQERNERIARWETDEDDCFMSMRVEQQALANISKQLAILSGDGCAEREVVVDENGEEVSVHMFANRWGGTSYVARGVFASSEKALLKKTGWTLKTIRVPVWTKFTAGGSGMYGAYAGSYEVVRWHTNMVTGEYVGYPD